MRTNIDIDDDLMARAMQAGPYTTKKDAVEAGLKLLARQAAYREILKWRGKLPWEGDADADWTQPLAGEPALPAAEPVPPAFGKVASVGDAAVPATTPAPAAARPRRARR
jgi:Arc/MetJ family transcription regulator